MTDIRQAQKLLEMADNLVTKLEEPTEEVKFWRTRLGNFILRATIKITNPIAKLNLKAKIINESPDDYYLVKNMNKGYKLLKQLRDIEKDVSKKLIRKSVSMINKLDAIDNNEVSSLARLLQEEIDRLCPERRKELDELKESIAFA